MTSVTIQCVHAVACAGCPAIDLPYDRQLSAKQARLRAELARYPELASLAIEGVRAADPIVDYRSRVKWMAAGKASLGLFRKDRDHEVLDIPECRIVTPTVRQVGEAIRVLLRERPEGVGSWWGPVGFEGRGALRAVDLREVRGKTGAERVLVTLVIERTRDVPTEEATLLAEQLHARCSSVVGVALNRVDPKSPQVLGPNHELVWGEGDAWDQAGDVRVKATFGSFVQAHRVQAAWIQRRLVELIVDTKRGSRRPKVLDLFGGSGALGLALAKHADVELVESFGPAARQAQMAADADHLSLRATTDDASRALQRLVAERMKFDLVVVNPPRRGTSPAVREAMAATHARQVAYVSCDPSTLARDLDHLLRLGYLVESIEPLDMIPLSDEVETLVVLRAGKTAAPRILFEDDTLIAVEKSPHEPTTPQGEYVGSLLDRVRLIRGAEDAVPIHRLDIGTSGVCLFARRPLHVKHWSDALGAETSKKEYVAAVKGKIPPRGSINRPIREAGKDLASHTKYKRQEWMGGHSLVSVFPAEGRTHQVRKHLAAIGFPILGDERYGHEPTNRYFEEKLGLDRSFLHCHSIEMIHPVYKTPVKIVAELPGDLLGVIEGLKGRRTENV